MMHEIEALAAKNLGRAREIIQELDMAAIWARIGATVNLVGSTQSGLMMKHRDIDFHVYSDTLDVEKSFSAMAVLAARPAITRVEFTNMADCEDSCLDWHAWYRDVDGELWQLDIIHILRGSAFDGYVEKVTERVRDALTPETRAAILRLKFETPDGEKIMGIEYYQAVLRDGVRTWDEFAAWRKQNPADPLVMWMP